MFVPRYSSDSAAVAGADPQFSSKERCYELSLFDRADCSGIEHELALRSCGLIDPLTGTLTRAGLLLTGIPNFQMQLPETANFVIRAFYSTQGNSLKDIQGLQQQYEDSKLFDGPLLQQIQGAADWIRCMQWTPYSKRLVAVATTGGSTSEYVGCSHRQYAEEAIWEILVNAVCHRDYDKMGQAIQVWMFERALEIVVPGNVMPDAGDLNQQPRTDHRNLNICMLLTRATNRQTQKRYFEGIGSGIALAKSKQQQQGGSISYQVQRSHVLVRVTAIPTPRSTEGGADNASRIA